MNRTQTAFLFLFFFLVKSCWKEITTVGWQWKVEIITQVKEIQARVIFFEFCKAASGLYRQSLDNFSYSECLTIGIYFFVPFLFLEQSQTGLDQDIFSAMTLLDVRVFAAVDFAHL